jgi:protein phosphatase 2C family protein 2/3
MVSPLFQHVAAPTSLPAAQASALLTIDHHYYLATSSADDSAGTTALAALIWGSALYIANVGDSRAVLSRRGKAVQLTRDHKAVEPAERRRIEAAGGFVCTEGRLCGELAVSRALGNHHRNLKGELATPSRSWWQREPQLPSAAAAAAM